MQDPAKAIQTRTLNENKLHQNAIPTSHQSSDHANPTTESNLVDKRMKDTPYQIRNQITITPTNKN